ncbi:hypothetical protein EBS02_07990 [bacterium]|nr:hypothetical protein [bacterium]NBX72603.1 hypothetical protein [bacterium]
MLQPKLNKWYQDAESMDIFKVVDLTEDSVGIQYANGLITEFSIEDWFQLHLLPAAQPEDWSMAWDLSEEDKGQIYNQDEDHHHKTHILDDDDAFQAFEEDLSLDEDDDL